VKPRNDLPQEQGPNGQEEEDREHQASDAPTTQAPTPIVRGRLLLEAALSLADIGELWRRLKATSALAHISPSGAPLGVLQISFYPAVASGDAPRTSIDDAQSAGKPAVRSTTIAWEV